ncbi:MAG: hydroxymethylbilane synthase [Acidobacteriota bacterium]
MRIRVLSRGSDLATLQARLVATALRARWPALDVSLATQSSEGDRDRRIALWDATEKGLFTTDLSQALVDHHADLVVHSWKDLPIEPYPGTTIAGTLERADARDVLLLRRDVVEARPASLTVLTSSPRRMWQIERSLAPLLPWAIATISTTAVRGNIPTRLAKLVAGEAHGLVVAKAALDRLLSPDATPQIAAAVRTAIEECRWMVLPLREFPTAPAQGALAIEAAADATEVRELVGAIDHAPTRRAVDDERGILAEAGGGCHEAIGASVRVRDYGTVTSVRGRMPNGQEREVWSLRAEGNVWPRVAEASIWPRRDERDCGTRHPMVGARVPADSTALWIARADAVPEGFVQGDGQIVWASGSRTWEKLARRGIWVHGSAEGLGDSEEPTLDVLANAKVQWLRVTHADSGDPSALATYTVERPLPDDLDRRTHFFWTSGSLFLRALERYPAIRVHRHASGPGRTSQVIRETLGPSPDARVWLDYDQWLQNVIR